MKSIMVINSKGGSGKTTVSVNLAAYCAQKGFQTTLVDLDPQQSSSQWLEVRPASKSKISHIQFVQSLRNYPQRKINPTTILQKW